MAVRKSEKEIANEKSERIMAGVAAWGSFYRANPHRFAKDYLGIDLKWFQKILIYLMFHREKTMYIASRGQGKTFLVAVFAVCYCILYPHTIICVASDTRGQANGILKKIEELCRKANSHNLRREIEGGKPNVSQNNANCVFLNGSMIEVVTSADSARGHRCNILIIDEFVKIDPVILNDVLKPFLTSRRNPEYLKNPIYSHMIEENKEIYMSSAWYKSHWSFELFKSFFANMLGEKDYFVCDLPYQLSIRENLLGRKRIENEMLEATFDEIKFSMEYGGEWFGDLEGSFFSYEAISNLRKLSNPIYPPNTNINIKTKSSKVPELEENERRILSVDIALMASKKKKKNDATSIIINRARALNDTYVGDIVYAINYEGLTSDELSLLIRRLYDYYKCTDLVMDTSGLGLPIYDLLIKDMADPEMGKNYHALSCCNNKDMAERCKVVDAPKVIWSIKGNLSFNSECCNLLRSAFQQKKINLLLPVEDAENFLNESVKYNTLSIPEKQFYISPFLQTTLIIYELINLQYEIKNNNTVIYEKSGMRKDRYSSLSYNYWVQYQLEINNLRKSKQQFDIEDYIHEVKKLNKKPKMY